MFRRNVLLPSSGLNWVVTFLWVVTPCTLQVDTNVKEEHGVSRFRVNVLLATFLAISRYKLNACFPTNLPWRWTQNAVIQLAVYPVSYPRRPLTEYHKPFIIAGRLTHFSCQLQGLQQQCPDITVRGAWPHLNNTYMPNPNRGATFHVSSLLRKSRTEAAEKERRSAFIHIVTCSSSATNNCGFRIWIIG
jgi:hypothetical protein